MKGHVGRTQLGLELKGKEEEEGKERVMEVRGRFEKK